FRIRQISRSFLLQSCGRGWNTDRGRCTPSVRNESNPVEDATMTVNWMEGIWKLDESCTSNPRSEILDWTAHPRPPAVHFQFRLSDLRCRIRPISNSGRRSM